MKNIIINFFLVLFLGGWIIYGILTAIIDDENMVLIISSLIILFISSLIEIKNIKETVKDKEKQIKIKYEKLESDLKKEYYDAYNQKEQKLNYKEKLINNYLNDELASKPYLAESIADLYWYCDNYISEILKHKKRPALSASETVKQIGQEKRQLQKELRILKYQIGIYEDLFPDLIKYKEATVKDIELYINDTEVNEDEAKHYLSIDEWNNLSTIEKYQLSLDRYKISNKTKWQIGREFERFVGYQYEIKGYKVIYNGANEGLEDLGRDLIAIKGKNILIIQCKYWSENKTIHEKHIFQLYGTTLLKQLENKNLNIRGIFICTNKVSEKAREIAKSLNIELLENYKFDKEYPCIKCNISRKNGEKIYHLPFDQQYDKIEIEINKGEKYVATVKEAEKLGFRRAKKHLK